jgi:hypothetical protein
LVGGGVVAALGVYSAASARRLRDLPLAALPLILGAHQLIEAVVWRNALDGGCAAAAPLARTVWAVIAFPLLPAFIPLAVLLADRADPTRRGVLLGLAAIGSVTAAVFARDLAVHSVTARVAGHTMQYGIGVPFAPLFAVGYLLATVAAPLTAADREIRLLGLGIAVGATVCGALFLQAFASTWCAFAALISLLVIRAVRRPVSVTAGGL